VIAARLSSGGRTLNSFGPVKLGRQGRNDQANSPRTACGPCDTLGEKTGGPRESESNDEVIEPI